MKRLQSVIHKIALSIFILLSTKMSAQNYWNIKYTEADGIAAKVKKTTDIKKLSHSLTGSLPDTIDKFRAIFSWIALNISYDVKGLVDYSKVKTKPIDVISSGKTVCEGYSNLFEALCKASELPSAFITGWTKNMPEKIGKPFAKHTTHAWNAIRINRKWYLCDVTWAAGSIDEQTRKFKKEFNDFYFCMPEALFCKNHYPEETKWINGYKLSQDDFINLPHFFHPALAANIRDLKPSQGIIKFKKKGTIKFSFLFGETIQSILIQTTGSSIPKQIAFKQKKEHVSFEYEMDQYAQFLYIFINTKGTLVYRLER